MERNCTAGNIKINKKNFRNIKLFAKAVTLKLRKYDKNSEKKQFNNRALFVGPSS